MDILIEAENILKKSVGWIELDLNIDLDLWKKEALSVSEFLVDHREGEGHIGWKSCCLHGISIDKTGHWSNYSSDEDDVVYRWTELTDIVPGIADFWKKFPTENFARLRFMELAAGGRISPHNDAPNGIKNTDFNMMDHMIPINIAISHPEGCDMFLETFGKVPWKEGRAFIVNITDTHSVYNNSSRARMHMIAHCIVGNKKQEFSELIVRSFNKFHGKI